MFNLPTNVRLPGFRVGPPDDPRDQGGATEDPVPGFAVSTAGYASDGSAAPGGQ